MKDSIMSSLKYFRAAAPQAPNPASQALRRLAAAGLRSASAALARLSHRLTLRLPRPVDRGSRPAPQLEFYAEAGAPEGALHLDLDGQLVGLVSGVKRL
jgi:hypothetical protein